MFGSVFFKTMGKSLFEKCVNEGVLIECIINKIRGNVGPFLVTRIRTHHENKNEVSKKVTPKKHVYSSVGMFL